MILAIDPGPTESAFVIMENDLKPIAFNKVDNFEMLEVIKECNAGTQRFDTAIEMVASYGMPVGKEVFETCVWIGRFVQSTEYAKFIYRKSDVCSNLCHSSKATDANVSQALRDRFGDKGTKKTPGWFYGFSGDIWQAYAVGVTYADIYLKGGQDGKSV